MSLFPSHSRARDLSAPSREPLALSKVASTFPASLPDLLSAIAAAPDPHSLLELLPRAWKASRDGGKEVQSQFARVVSERLAGMEFAPKALLHVAWKLREFGIRDFKIWRTLSDRFLPERKTLSTKQLVTLLVTSFWAGIRDSKVVDEFVSRMRGGEKILTHEVANYGAAWRSVGLSRDTVLGSVVDTKLPPHEQWELLARMGVTEADANVGLLKAVRLSLDSLSTESFIATVRTASLYRNLPWQFAGEFHQAVVRALNEYSVVDAWKVSKSFAHCRPTLAFHWEKISGAALRALSEKPQSVSVRDSIQLLEDYSHFDGERLPSLIEALHRKIEPALSRLSFKDISDLLASISRMKATTPEQLSSLLEAAEQQAAHASTYQAMVVMWSMAVFNERREPLWEQMLNRVSGSLSELSSEAQARLAWSVAVFGDSRGEILWRKIAENLNRPGVSLTSTGVEQIIHSGLALGIDPESPIMEVFVGKHSPQPADRVRLSYFEKQVSAALRESDLMPRIQVPVVGYRLDNIIEVDGRLYAVECEGRRFHRNTGTRDSRALGRDTLRERALAAVGIETIRISDVNLQGKSPPDFGAWVVQHVLQQTRAPK